MHEQALLLQSVSIGFFAIGILTGVVPLPLLHKKLFRNFLLFLAGTGLENLSLTQ
jgi:hypothetical protein